MERQLPVAGFAGSVGVAGAGVEVGVGLGLGVGEGVAWAGTAMWVSNSVWHLASRVFRNNFRPSAAHQSGRDETKGADDG